MKRIALVLFLVFIPVSFTGCQFLKTVWDGITYETEQADEQDTLVRLLILEQAYSGALSGLSAVVNSGSLTGDSARRAIQVGDAANAAVRALRDAYEDGQLGVTSDFEEARKLVGELILIVKEAENAS